MHELIEEAERRGRKEGLDAATSAIRNQMRVLMSCSRALPGYNWRPQRLVCQAILSGRTAPQLPISRLPRFLLSRTSTTTANVSYGSRPIWPRRIQRWRLPGLT